MARFEKAKLQEIDPEQTGIRYQTPGQGQIVVNWNFDLTSGPCHQAPDCYLYFYPPERHSFPAVEPAVISIFGTPDLPDIMCLVSKVVETVLLTVEPAVHYTNLRFAICAALQQTDGLKTAGGMDMSSAEA